MLTQNYTNYVIAQQYLPAAKHGDKRILLSDGNPIGALLRVHDNSDHRNNFFAGGSAKPAKITASDTAIINKLKPYLSLFKEI